MTVYRSFRAVLLATAVAAAPALALAPAMVSAQALIELPSYAPLVEAVKPAVVTVVTKSATGPEHAAQRRTPDELEEFMERFFRDRPRPDMRRPNGPRPRPQGLGSGFIIDASGIIVTNDHVISGAEEITVILDDGTELEAEVVGSDAKVDLAVLRVKADGPLPTVGWGDSDALRVGDWAVAIGNPLGLDGTVTAGIVSARGRDINSGPYDDYIQVDAAINRGNSGGPLFDLEGNVVGVNTAIISPSGGNVGLGFAIPANQAQNIVADLMEDGTVERGWIGVSIQPVSREIADSLGLDEAEGALVAEVVTDSPAEAAGLRAGDVILSFAESDITELRDLTRAVAAFEIGAPAELVVWRDGKEKSIEIRPGNLETASLATPALPAGMVAVPELGLTLDAPDAGSGARVSEVDDGTPAAESGLRRGDVILSLNQTEIDAPDTVRAALDTAKERELDSVLVLIEREGARRFVTLEIADA